MGLIAKQKVDFEPIPEGMHPAVCYAVIDLGHQYSEKFKKYNHKVLIMWELPLSRIQITREGETEARDLPRGCSKEYGLSLHRKADLRNDLESWRGKSFTETELAGFDVSKLPGVNATLQILHTSKDEKIYANVKAILPLPKEQWKKPENPIKVFIFGESTALPECLPEWVLEKIKLAKEWSQFEAQLNGGNTSAKTPEELQPPSWIDEGPEHNADAETAAISEPAF